MKRNTYNMYIYLLDNDKELEKFKHPAICFVVFLRRKYFYIFSMLEFLRFYVRKMMCDKINRMLI